MPAARRASAAVLSSGEIQEVQLVFLTIQRKMMRFTGSFALWTRWAISRRMGSMNVVPVDPATRRIVSNEAKSL